MLRRRRPRCSCGSWNGWGCRGGSATRRETAQRRWRLKTAQRRWRPNGATSLAAMVGGGGLRLAGGSRRCARVAACWLAAMACGFAGGWRRSERAKQPSNHRGHRGHRDTEDRNGAASSRHEPSRTLVEPPGCPGSRGLPSGSPKKIVRARGAPSAPSGLALRFPLLRVLCVIGSSERPGVGASLARAEPPSRRAAEPPSRRA